MRKFATNIVASVFGRGAQFLASILIARAFGKDVFREYSTAVSAIIAAYTGATFGITYALSRPCVDGRGKTSRQLLIVLCHGAPAAMGLLILVVSSQVRGSSIPTMLAMGAILMMYVHYGVLMATVYFQQRYHLAAAVSNAGPGGILAVAAAAFLLGGTPHYLLLVTAFVTSPVVVAYAAGVRVGFQPSLLRRLTWNRASRMIRNAGAYSIGVALPAFGLTLIPTAFLVSTVTRSPTTNGIFAVGFAITNILSIVPNAISNIVLSERKRSSLTTILALVGTVAIGASVLWAGGFRLLATMMGASVVLHGAEMTWLIVGAAGVATARIVTSDLLREGQFIGVTSITLGVMIALGMTTMTAGAIQEHYWVPLYAAVGTLPAVAASTIWFFVRQASGDGKD